MFVPHKLQKIILANVQDSEWQGDWQYDMPVTYFNREWIDVTPYAKQMGIKLKKKSRYAEHGDLEEQIHTGDHEEPGDGDGESQE